MLEQIAMQRLPHPPVLTAAPQADMTALEQVARLLASITGSATWLS